MQNGILVGRYGQLLNKLFGIKGSNPAPQVGPEVMPILAIEELAAPELRFLRQVRSWVFSQTVAAAAGFFSKVGVMNPAGSGVLSVVEGIHVSDAVTQRVRVGLVTGPIGVVATTFFRDSRINLALAGAPAPVTQGFTQNNNAIAADGIQVGMLASPSFGNDELLMPVVLAPNNIELIVAAQTVNQQIDVTIWGYERTLEPSEVQT